MFQFLQKASTQTGTKLMIALFIVGISYFVSVESAHALTAPSSLATSTIAATSITISWTETADGENVFAFGKSTDGTTFTTTTMNSAGTYSGATSTAFTSLTANTKYWFRIGASNGIATTTLPTIDIYTLPTTPTAPTVGTPTTSALPITVANDGATGYAIRVVSTTWTGYLQPTGVLGASAVWYTYAQAGNGSATTTSGLVSNTQYTVGVTGRNVVGSQTATTTAAAVYTLTTTPTTPTIGTPTTSAIPLTLVDTSATTYSVKVASSSWTGYLQNNSTLGATQAWLTFAQHGSGTTSTTGLVANTSYIVTLAGKNGDGVISSSTPATAKYTLTNVPSSLSATGGTTNVSVSWSGDTAEEYYAENVNYSTSNSGWISVTTYNFTTNLFCGSNSFRVKGRNGDTTETTWATTVVGTVSCGGSEGGSGGSQANLNNASVNINNGAAVTDSLAVTLNFKATGAIKMMVSNSSDFVNASWINFAPIQNWSLIGDKGQKVIYVKYKDIGDVISTVVSASIKYDPIAVVAPTTPTAPSSETQPSASVQPTQVETQNAATEEPVLVLSKPESKVQITKVNDFSLQPGTKLSFYNEFKNETEKSLKLKSITQILNSKWKSVYSSSNTKVIKAGDILVTKYSQLLGKKLAAGEYTVKVKVVNAKSGTLLDDNDFKVVVEKLKQTTFVLGAVESASSDLYFDENSLGKIKSEVVLPFVLKVQYGYINNSGQKQTIKMTRELVNGDGKVLSSNSGKWVMKVGEKDALYLSQSLSSNTASGDYKIRIKALDWNTKEIIAENSLGFSVILK